MCHPQDRAKPVRPPRNHDAISPRTGPAFAPHYLASLTNGRSRGPPAHAPDFPVERGDTVSSRGDSFAFVPPLIYSRGWAFVWREERNWRDDRFLLQTKRNVGRETREIYFRAGPDARGSQMRKPRHRKNQLRKIFIF